MAISDALSSYFSGQTAGFGGSSSLSSANLNLGVYGTAQSQKVAASVQSQRVVAAPVQTSNILGNQSSFKSERGSFLAR